MRGLGGMRRNGYFAELFEDASLIEDYLSARSPYCAIWLVTATEFDPYGEILDPLAINLWRAASCAARSNLIQPNRRSISIKPDAALKKASFMLRHKGRRRSGRVTES